METQCEYSGNPVEFTDHAVRRCQQRGIRIKYASLAAVYGKKTRAKKGRFTMLFNKSSFQKAVRTGDSMPKAEIENAVGVSVIVAIRNGVAPKVVTVLPKSSK